MRVFQEGDLGCKMLQQIVPSSALGHVRQLVTPSHGLGCSIATTFPKSFCINGICELIGGKRHCTVANTQQVPAMAAIVCFLHSPSPNMTNSTSPAQSPKVFPKPREVLASPRVQDSLQDAVQGKSLVAGSSLSCLVFASSFVALQRAWM